MLVSDDVEHSWKFPLRFFFQYWIRYETNNMFLSVSVLKVCICPLSFFCFMLFLFLLENRIWYTIWTINLFVEVFHVNLFSICLFMEQSKYNAKYRLENLHMMFVLSNNVCFCFSWNTFVILHYDGWFLYIKPIFPLRKSFDL